MIHAAENYESATNGIVMKETSSARLLVVDDEVALLETICANLRTEGYRVTGVTSSQAGLDALRDAQFDVLLTDLTMPGMDGIGLVRTALKRDANLVAVVMTGHGTIATAVAALQSGAIDYILKPFAYPALRPVLDRALMVQRLRRKNAALERRALEHAEELEKANRELVAYSYSVSHDLTAPVRAITGFSEILLQDFGAALPAEARRLLDRIFSSSQRMEKMIAALLNLSRVGRHPVARQPVNLVNLVHEVLAELGRNHSGRIVDVTVANLPGCVGDPALLRQVFVNLLSNAFKFSRRRTHPRVEVGCRTDNGTPVYFVRDNGAGFEQVQAEKLFVVFHRLNPLSEYEGSGIGLSIVQRIVERHGGRVWAEGRPDHGATFYFTLPGIPAPDAVAAGPARS